jgi:hypothetical protein
MQREMLKTKPASTSHSEIEFAVQIGDLHDNWRRVGLLANYLAEYVAYQFQQRERADNLISTITNEILEAVVSLAPYHTEMLLQCRLSDHGLTLDVKHYVKAGLSHSYIVFVENLDQDKDEKAYLEMLTSDVKPELYFNQLGLTMLEHDFNVRLSLDVDEKQNNFCTHVNILDEVLAR